MATHLIKQAAIGLLAIAGADYFFQRHQLTKSLMMTKQEVKDDRKMTRRQPRDQGRGCGASSARWSAAGCWPPTKKATVVITNPTHFAVALEYRRNGMPAPGSWSPRAKDFMASGSRTSRASTACRWSRTSTLARALYAEAEVGDVIPGALFEAVAEILAYLIRLKQLVLYGMANR